VIASVERVSMTAFRPDIIIHREDGSPVAAVEVKNPTNLTRAKAIELRRHYVQHGKGYQTPYFMLVSQDKGYMWVRPPSQTNVKPRVEPSAEFSMGDVVKRYLPHQDPVGYLQEPVMQMLVTSWLNGLVYGYGPSASGEDDPERTLAGLGFLDSIRGGVVDAQS
jgi:hypothetical protein